MIVQQLSLYCHRRLFGKDSQRRFADQRINDHRKLHVQEHWLDAANRTGFEVFRELRSKLQNTMMPLM